MTFDRDGNLILPRGTVEEFNLERAKFARKGTGLWVECPRCGYSWLRYSVYSKRLKCTRCDFNVPVEPFVPAEEVKA